MIRFALNGIMYFQKTIEIGHSNWIFQYHNCFGFVNLYSLWLFFSNKAVAGWASTLTIVIFFGGIQLLTIGLVAQYIANIFDEVKADQII